jgi:hypothetical protein
MYIEHDYAIYQRRTHPLPCMRRKQLPMRHMHFTEGREEIHAQLYICTDEFIQFCLHHASQQTITHISCPPELKRYVDVC